MKIKRTLQASGEGRAIVKNELGEVIQDSGWNRNILTSSAMQNGIIGNVVGFQVIYYESADTANPIPNKIGLLGTFDLVDETLTASHTGIDFGDNSQFRTGDTLVFSNDARMLISAVGTNTCTVVAQNDVVNFSGQTANHYRTGFTSNAAAVSMGEVYKGFGSGGFTNGNIDSTGTKITTVEVTTATQTSNFTINVFYTSYYSRVVLDTPIIVEPGNTITFLYRATFTMQNPSEENIIPSASKMVGWPYQNAISSATSDGSTITITTDNVHDLEAGDNVTLSNFLPSSITATLISSDGSTWTITADNTFANGDSIVIESNGGNYDGTFTVATATASSFTISNTGNFADSNGTVRHATPSNWYDGDYVVDNVVDVNTLEILDTLNEFDADSGTIGVVNANYRLNLWYDWAREFADTTINLYQSDTEVVTAPFPTWSDTDFLTSIGFTNSDLIPETVANTTPAIANGMVSSATITTTINVANNFPRIKQLGFDSLYHRCIFTFDEVQKLPNNLRMVLKFELQFLQDLD
ncbi:hypothetical protein OAB00_01285 [Akkermansiaceae bacterium]|nr:hypothetical protein [Akkermansiaceae bacterium]